MIKNCFLLFTILFLSFAASARGFSLRYDEYVHLSDEEKDQVVIQIMEFVVELESKYDYDVQRYGENSPQAEKAKIILTKIASFLTVSSAFAAPPASSWKKYADDFKILLQDTKEADCVFGGWPSKTYKIGTRTICSHPSKSTSAKVNAKYPKAPAQSTCGKSGTLKIQCNPALFGFKDMKSNSLFCVDSSNGAENSAYHCMKAALGDGNRDARLKMLRENLNSHPEIFAALQKYVYELCICKSTPSGFSKPYHERIRPHRTCYGMMNMLGEISCGIDSALLKDTSIFKELKEKIALDAKQGDIDELYTDFLRKVPEVAPEEYARMCPNDPAIIITSGPDKDNGGSPGGAEGGNPKVPGTNTPGTTPGPGTGGSTETPSDSDEKFTCTQAVCTPTKDEDASKPQFACEFKIQDNVNKIDIVLDTDPAPVYEPPKDASQESVSVVGFINKEKQEFSCPTSPAEENSGDDKTKEDDKGDKPTLKLEYKVKGPLKYDIKAVTTNDKGWKLKWTIEAPAEIKVPKGWKEAKDKKDEKEKPLAGIAADSPEDKEDKKEEPKDGDASTKANSPEEKEKPVVPGDSPNAVQDRLKTDYKVCAQLHRGDEKSPESPECVKVDKLAAPALKGGMQGPPQPQMRRTLDTRAIGIR